MASHATNISSVVDLEYQSIPMRTTLSEGDMLISDSPEYPSSYGILARGTMQGKGRIYYYNVNDTGGIAQIVTYVNSNKDTTLKVKRNITGDTSLDYIHTGRTLSKVEARDKKEEVEQTISLKADTLTILTTGESQFIPEAHLASGIIDVETLNPVTFGVAILPVKDKSIKEQINQIENAKILEADAHDRRGIFPLSVIKESISCWDISSGPGKLIVGDGVEDLFYQGYDELDGQRRVNVGNFGMTYDVIIHTCGKGQYRLYFNPLGGIYEGVFTIKEKSLPLVYEVKGRRRYFGEKTIRDTWPMGVWHAGQDLHLHFVIAGATYLPFQFLLVPIDA